MQSLKNKEALYIAPLMPERVMMPDGLLSMSDAVFSVALFHLDVEPDDIHDLMFKQPETRENILDDYRRSIY